MTDFPKWEINGRRCPRNFRPFHWKYATSVSPDAFLPSVPASDRSACGLAPFCNPSDDGFPEMGNCFCQGIFRTTCYLQFYVLFQTAGLFQLFQPFPNSGHITECPCILTVFMIQHRTMEFLKSSSSLCPGSVLYGRASAPEGAWHPAGGNRRAQ